MLVSHEGWILISDRTPLKSRWGGWYVTGMHGSQVHLGNMVIKTLYDFDRLEELRVGNVDTLDALVDVKPFPTNTSDIVALLVLQHQADVQNLITRLNYDARTAEDKRAEPLEETAERLLRMMLFVDAVEYTDAISGRPEFVEQFARRGVRDAQGRSLRDFDLTRRLFRYPLSYVIYSPAFDALPDDAKGMFYRALERGVDGCRHERGLRAPDRRRSHRDSRDPARHETRRRGRRSQLTVALRGPSRPATAARSMTTTPPLSVPARVGDRVRDRLHRLGLDVPRDPVRDRDVAAVSDGERSVSHRGRVALRVVAHHWRRGCAGPRAVACDGRRRCAAPPRRQRPRRLVRAADSIRGRGAARRHGAVLHGAARLAAAERPAADRARRRRARLGPARSRLARRPGFRHGRRARRSLGRRGPRVRVVLLGVRLDLLAAGADAGLAVPVDGDADARGRASRCSPSVVALGEPWRFDASAVSLRSLLGFLYLVVFGSLVAFSAYVWLLRASTPARVSTYAYVNPVVAVLLGAAFAGEALTVRMIVAAVVIVSGVALITLAPRRV